jgi:hypothetical protein
MPELNNLQVSWISLVDKGANRKTMLILKIWNWLM